MRSVMISFLPSSRPPSFQTNRKGSGLNYFYLLVMPAVISAAAPLPVGLWGGAESIAVVSHVPLAVLRGPSLAPETRCSLGLTHGSPLKSLTSAAIYEITLLSSPQVLASAQCTRVLMP